MTNSSKPHSALRPTLSIFDVVAITVSGISPASSLFVIAPFAIKQSGSGAFLAFVMAALLALMFAYCYAELGLAHKSAGGDYVYATRIFGGMIGFMTFVITLALLLFIPPVLATGAAVYLNAALSTNFDPQYVGLLIIVLAYLCGILNIKLNAFITGFCLFVELIAILVMSLLGFGNISQPVNILFEPQIFTNGVLHMAPWTLVIGSLGIALLSYNGYGTAVLLSEDMTCEGKKVHKAVLWSLLIVVILELLPLTALILGAPSLEVLIRSSDPIGYLFLSHGNELIKKIISAGIFLSVFNAIIALVILISRVIFSSGRDLLWPSRLNRLFTNIHPRFNSPWLATLFLALPSALLTFNSNLGELTSFSVLLIMLMYFIVSCCALMSRIVLKGHSHPYSMPFWPLPAIVAMLGSGFLIVDLIMATKTRDIVIIFSVLLVSCLYYMRYGRFILNFQANRKNHASM